MGRLCARQSNIPRPPFPSRNRLDEVHAARSAQTICAFRRGGCHPPAGRTLCAPTLRVLFLGRVELQGEVRDMGPGRRCHAADWAHGRVDKPSDSGQTRFGLWPSLGSAHPFPTYLPYAPILRASLSRSHWARGRVDNSDDSAKTHSRLGRSLGFWHPLCRYLPCAPMGRA